MKIEQAEERKEINIQISDIVQEGGILNIFPSVKKFFSIDYKPRNDKLSLVAGGFIGLIPINSNLAIEIRPKFSLSNLTRMVAVAEDNFNTLSFFSKKYKKSGTPNNISVEFMVECFINELQTLDSEGLFKDYITKQDQTNKIRGRININNSIKLLWSHGHFNKVDITYFDFTTDNIFNRLIKFTLKFCIEELQYIDSSRHDLIDLLIEYYSMFDSVQYDNNIRCYDEVFTTIENDKITELRNYYVNICEICRLIIKRTGINFDVGGDDIKLNSFTLDMATTFEKYLLNSLRLNRDVFSENTVILNGNTEGRKKFYNQPSHGKGDAKPDIIIKEGDVYQIIADAKYKVRTKDSDRYQVISHALSYGAKIAVLILPMDDKYNGIQLVKIGDVGNEYQIDVYEYYFDLSNYDLTKEEKILSQSLSTLYTM